MLDMSKFKFELPANQDSATVYSKVKSLLNGDNDFKKFDPKVNCSFDDSSKTCNVKGSQFQATMQIIAKDTSNCQVSVEVELPMAFALFKGKIKETLEKNLSKLLT